MYMYMSPKSFWFCLVSAFVAGVSADAVMSDPRPTGVGFAVSLFFILLLSNIKVCISDLLEENKKEKEGDKK